MTAIRTARLVLRGWEPRDAAPFAALNADPAVMEYFPAPLTAAESNALAHRMASELAVRGWGWWALEPLAGDQGGHFAGCAGLGVPDWDPPFGPCVEIGWRLAHWAWGRGYATEAARAALDVAFGRLGLPEVVAFTAIGNARSRAVMERLGMRHDEAGDFDHPALPPAHPLRRHALYRLKAAAYRRPAR